MSDNLNRKYGWTARLMPRTKTVLMASALAIGMTGVIAGQSVLFTGDSAQAEQIIAATAPASFADLVETVSPAVVSIRVKAQAKTEQSFFEGMPDIPRGHPLERFFRRFGEEGPRGFQNHPRRKRPFTQAQGSGFFISADGYAVTNNHVVENAEEVTVTTNSGKEYTAKVIGSDEKTDLALIKVEGNGDFPHVNFADEDIRVGDWVVAVGNPFGLGGTVTAGIVSARGRDIGAGPYDDFIQLDAPINRGNSGGPTFNLKGKVVGVNTAIFSPSGGSVGIGFAIPASTAKQIIDDLKDDGKVVRGWLGVHIQTVTDDIAEGLGLDEASGALVSEPQAGGPARKAGIKSGDVIVSVDGKKVDSAKELARRIAGYAPGSEVEIGLLRDGGDTTITVTLGKLTDAGKGGTPAEEVDPSDLDQLGLVLAPASSVAGAGDEGVAVTNVDPSGPAAERGIRTGDIILEVGGKPVSTPDDVLAALAASEKSGRNATLLRVRTGDATRFVALPVSRG
ncbi:MAG: hypothetical protein C0606_00615 [Hyphomicrobiales bacterium]|nr:MAG: hypothetical protein C0606_00615 [Hyphomicrobiales bacterium]